jgi:hypothetical protein
MQNQQDYLKTLTASSQQSDFMQVFDNKQGGGTLPSQRLELSQTITAIETHLEVTTLNPCPSQEMFDLYLLAIHYLLLFHKVGSHLFHVDQVPNVGVLDVRITNTFKRAAQSRLNESLKYVVRS